MHFFKSQLKIALISAVLIGHVPQAQAFDREKLLQSLFSIVMIKGYTADGSMAYGSGVVVGSNKIVTNCHIFRKTPKPFVSRGEDTYRITQVQADRYYDICLVGTEQTPFKPAEIGSITQKKKGEEIMVIGHSSGNPSPVSANGTIKSIYPFNHAYIIRSSARFTMGASGSGLFDSQGRLIGINTFKSPGRNSYFYALPIEWLANVEKQPIETIFPIEGKTFWEEDDEQKPYFMKIAIPQLNEDWENLVTICEKWAKAEPNNDEAWYELGNAMDHLNKRSDAETAYRMAIQINKGHTQALYALGLIALSKGNKKEAKGIKLAILDIDPELSEAFDKEIIKSEK